MELNPFSVYEYLGPDYFCDREEEVAKLVSHFENRRHVVLYSRRRLGKTGLIHHFHNRLEQKKYTCIYVDVMDTTSDAEFIKKLVSETVISLQKRKTGFIDQFTKIFASLSPTFSYNPITGEPKVSLQINNKEDVVDSLSALMDLLGSYDKVQFQFAIDEFQQIDNYEETSVIDATLRGFFHKAPNVHFLFSGSEEHILLDIFGSAKRPLFASVEQMKLDKIGYQFYFDFIQFHFQENGKTIPDTVIHTLIKWTDLHTYYTQITANKLYGNTKDQVTELALYQLQKSILLENEPYYLQIRSMLSTVQYRLLCAVATEGVITAITGKDFLSKYGLSGSSVLKAIKALQEYDLVYQRQTVEKEEYIVNDPFLAHWLKEKGYYSYQLDAAN